MSTHARSKTELSNDEINNYWAAYFIVSDALSLCRDKLLSLENNSEDPASQDSFRAARSNIDANLEMMQALRISFNNGRSKVKPPDAALIRALAMGSAKATGIAGDPTRLPEVIEVTTEILSKFHALQEL